MKFYTEDGNWDLVGNNTPVFFVKDPKKFGDFIHTQKRDPRTNCKSPTMMWVVYPQIYSTDVHDFTRTIGLTPKPNTCVTRGKKGSRNPRI